MGGEAFFADLVSQFYARVATNPILRPMYPDEDMKGAALRLQWFLEQYWGGPTTYGDSRGHPRLRMRHAQFHIDTKARDARRAVFLFGDGGKLDGESTRLRKISNL